MRGFTLFAAAAILLVACASQGPLPLAVRVADACNGYSQALSLLTDARRLGEVSDASWEIAGEVRAIVGPQCEAQDTIATDSALAAVKAQIDRLIAEKANAER